MRQLTLKLALMILGIGFSLSIQAQNVKGIVKDANGEAIVGVSVIVDGTTIGTTTGIDGDYSIDVPDASKDAL